MAQPRHPDLSPRGTHQLENQPESRTFTPKAGPTSKDANAVSNATFDRLLAGAHDGQLPRGVLQSAYQRILALKSHLGY
jgi:hypothetical protein